MTERRRTRNNRLQPMSITRIGGNLPSRRKHSRLSLQIHSEPSGQNITSLLRLSFNEVFNALKDQPWVRRTKPIKYVPALPGAEDYCCYYDNKGHNIAHCRRLMWYLKEFVRQVFFKEYIFTLKAASGAGQPSVPPPT